MTYSVVARDPETGVLGVAVQSAVVAVGNRVPWVRPGVGVVASQAFTEPAYGPRCLDAIAAGAGAADALAQASAADPEPMMRQVAVVAADGTVAVRTGGACIDAAGHVSGDGFAVQANMMAGDRVWPAMAEAFTGARGPFPRRMLAALRAAQDAGGDARGVMSAAVMVVAGQAAQPWAGRLVDVRVDHSTDPLGELDALLSAHDAWQHLNRGVDALYSGDATAALAEVHAGLAGLPGEENLRFLRARALLAKGDVEAGGAELRALIAARPSWEVLVRGFAAKGLLTLAPGMSLESLLG
ncbi:DUF1028 domain-containing protein [Streptomyces sp. NPDC046197]|uniref:DUF1028 domain-containing protein n=1 Tax=Streptomyces sp. NPDC046197 TaxID=3154337 RepID=UPI0033FDD542